ncbi:MAG: CPBP family intramembrane metalloprotease [Dehalococcoidia bacterium]|nr:MAG: CPBP family intramembrane metalloprotease [Dehalococcoidia bacterium]
MKSFKDIAMNFVGGSLIAAKEEPAGQAVTAEVSRRQWLFLIAILVAIGITEWVFAYKDVAYGIGMALFVVIGIYVVISVTRLDQLIANCAESLALIPLYILFTSSLPWFFINQQYLLPAVYSTIMGLCLWHIYQKKLSFSELGFKKDNWRKYVLMGIAIGIPIGTAEYFVLHPAPAFPTFEVQNLFRDAVYMLCFVGLGEELLFRGLVQRDLMKALGWKQGILLASLMFAVMHLTWRSVPELFFVFGAGLLLGYIYYRTKNLTTPIVAHGVGNVMLVAVMPYVIG